MDLGIQACIAFRDFASLIRTHLHFLDGTHEWLHSKQYRV